ncbi:MAG: AmmeMemoRadiSam system protein B [Candidatus Aenigmarchaeota archaeon]|nr:AmmeMemoRadiSam system protein B [Candidatus Aenigmarchaeota archaeon]
MEEIRYPAVAGAFYEDDKSKLSSTIDNFIKETKPGKNIGVVSPHAGYVYSGKTAAAAINSLKGAKTFIILGPNHTGIGAQFSVMCKGVWRTPLGEIKIDDDIAFHLEKTGVVDNDSMAHLNEHSIEVQLPFLQKKFKGFSIVPISILNIDYSANLLEKCIELGKRIAEIAKKKDINIVASSDFSHYIALEEAKEKDSKAVENILSLDIKNFFAVLETMDASVCGYAPIAVLMSAAKEMGLNTIEILHESSSGDVLRNYRSVVTYKAIGFR